MQIAAQDSGPVERLEVRDQQHVDAGELLFVIDPRPFVLAVEGAHAELDLAAQQMGEQTAAVDAARALVEQRRAERENAEANNRRLRDLVRQGLVSQQDAEAVRTEAETATAAVTAAQANLEQAQNALGKVGPQNAAVQVARARLRQAKLDLAHTRVTAPTSSGLVANFDVAPGRHGAKQAFRMFAIVGDRRILGRCELQGNGDRPNRAGPDGAIMSRHVPRSRIQGRSGEPERGQRAQAFSLLPRRTRPATG